MNLKVSELWTSLIPALRALFQIGKNQLGLDSWGGINVVLITVTYQKATEEERLISDIKLVSTATVDQINGTSHVYFTVYRKDSCLSCD